MCETLSSWLFGVALIAALAGMGWWSQRQADRRAAQRHAQAAFQACAQAVTAGGPWTWQSLATKAGVPEAAAQAYLETCYVHGACTIVLRETPEDCDLVYQFPDTLT